MSWNPDDYSDAASSTDANSVLQSLEAEHQQEFEHQQQVEETLTEAMKRIEEANLWKTLLSQDVFQQGSARPEIVNSINSKIKKFALNNLELCVGIRSESTDNKKAIQEIKSPFDQDETTALKILAAKVLKRDIVSAIQPQNYTPQIAAVGSTASPINMNTVSSSNLQGKSQQKPQTKAPVKKATKARPPNYIPPATGYVPATQGIATVSGQATGGLNLQNLVSNLVQNASGGNTLVQNTSSAGGDDVNERF